MLIGIDASRAVAAHPTGTEIYSKQLIQALLQSESKRTEPARHQFRLYFRDPPAEGVFPAADLRHIPFPRLWTHLRLSWEMARKPPDVLFVPAHVLPLIRPHVSLVTIHDLGYLHFPETHPWPQRLYLDLSTRWNARVATHIIAVSEATKADLVSHYRTPPDKITVAYHGYDETLIPIRDPARIEAAKARYAIDGDYFLYLGSLQPRKNLARIIDAFASVESQALLVLAGKRGWLYDDLFDQVRNLGLENRVLFPGYVHDEDKAALLSGTLAFVFPSLYEGFGLPVLEAQACGCPVITSTTSSLPEVTTEDAALLVNPEDTVAIAAAMQRTASDPTLRETLAERGFINVRRFSWATCAQTVLDVIERCTTSNA
ncbi:MAG: glycosyltransferase family 4 protein [Anaerolineae bacterium]|nr:glycosyltransferase family 4 protein [Anaerolineae bacterium]